MTPIGSTRSNILRASALMALKPGGFAAMAMTCPMVCSFSPRSGCLFRPLRRTEVIASSPQRSFLRIDPRSTTDVQRVSPPHAVETRRSTHRPAAVVLRDQAETTHDSRRTSWRRVRMYWHVITVPKKDFGLTLGAIGLGGGTITATKPSGGAIAITYITNDEMTQWPPAGH